jgi:hypothetical protein
MLLRQRRLYSDPEAPTHSALSELTVRFGSNDSGTPFTVFFPWEPSQIAKVTVIEQSGTRIPPPERGSQPHAVVDEFTFTCGMQVMRGKLIVESE